MAKKKSKPKATVKSLEHEAEVGIESGETLDGGGVAFSDSVAVSDSVPVNIEPIEVAVTRALIEVPLADAGNGYMTRHVEVGKLTADQKMAQRRLLKGLIAAGERLENGAAVKTNSDTWRWVLEQLGVGQNTEPED